jgi:hypothetical protein
MHHHHKHKKSHYSFRQFVHDSSKPFITVERDLTGAAIHTLDSFGKIGKSAFTPLIIIGCAGIAFIVLSRGK